MAASPDKRTRRPADETRREILRVAEEAFATVGFEATRLEDIASRIGVQRAALFYHFKDKQDLYASTLQQLWVDLGKHITEANTVDAGLRENLEQGLLAVVDFMVERPAFPHLILRLGSEPARETAAATTQLSEPLLKLLEQLLVEGEKQGLLKPATQDPALLAATLAGATIFYSAAMPTYSSATLLSKKKYRQELLAVLRRLLGMTAP